MDAFGVRFFLPHTAPNSLVSTCVCAHPALSYSVLNDLLDRKISVQTRMRKTPRVTLVLPEDFGSRITGFVPAKVVRHKLIRCPFLMFPGIHWL
jgi:hypothetical protein